MQNPNDVPNASCSILCVADYKQRYLYNGMNYRNGNWTILRS